MPRVIRNFWVELRVDGRENDVATGPKNKEGGFHETLYMRNDKEVVKVIELDGWATPEGVLRLGIWMNDKDVEFSHMGFESGHSFQLKTRR